MKYLFKYLFFTLVISMIFSTLLSQNAELYYDFNIPTNTENTPVDSMQYYFPITLLVDTTWEVPSYATGNIDKLQISVESANYCDRWYSRFLYDFREPLLFNKKIHKEVFRFTWLRTFNHPVVIRIEKFNDEIIMIVKQSDGQGGYDFGKIIDNRTIKLKKDDWIKFLSLINELDFWNLPSSKRENGLDGAEWILEGANEHNYQLVNRWSPNENEYSTFRQACLFLVELSKLNINTKDIY